MVLYRTLIHNSMTNLLVLIQYLKYVCRFLMIYWFIEIFQTYEKLDQKKLSLNYKNVSGRIFFDKNNFENSLNCKYFVSII